MQRRKCLVLTVSHITGVTLRSEKDVNMFEAETTEGYKICKKGDLAINTLWAWMGAMGIAPCDGIVSPAYNVYTPGAEMDDGYVEALVRMPIFAQEITRYSTGVWSSRLRLYSNQSVEDIAEGVMGVEMPQKSLRYQQMMKAAEEYFKLVRLPENQRGDIENVKLRLDELSAPFSDDPAYQALLKIEREINLEGGQNATA